MPESPLSYRPRNLHNCYAGSDPVAEIVGNNSGTKTESKSKNPNLPFPFLDLDSSPPSPSSGDIPLRIKLVFVGDGSVGKTSLLVSYTTNGYPTEYIPTAFDKYSVSVKVDNQPLRVQLFDTAGQDDFDSLRPLCYPDTDVFLICFSVTNPISFRNVRSKWLPEIQRFLLPNSSPNTPLILVGTQCDLRDDVTVLVELDRYNEHPVTDQEAQNLAKSIGASCYIECSALTQWNLKKVFDTAILAALNKNLDKERRTEPEPPTITCTQLLKRTASRTRESSKKIIPRRNWKKYCCIF